MTPSGGVSIRIYLVDGSPTGLWLVEKSLSTAVALVWPRVLHTEARQRAEFQRAGIYLLASASDEPLRQRIYIGEADSLRHRLDRHQRDMEFWTRAVVFTTKDASLNKAHVKYLESRLLELGRRSGRDTIENSNAPQRPALSEPEIADMEGYLAEMLLIFPVLDVRTFEPVVPVVAPSEGFLRLHGPKAAATGIETADGFLVQSGSVARGKIVPSASRWVGDLRTQLMQSGVLVRDGESFRFSCDHLFTSPSSAAAVVLGRNANGRTEWRDEGGRTLQQIQTDSVT